MKLIAVAGVIGALILLAMGPVHADCGGATGDIRALRADSPNDGTRVAVRGVVAARFGGDGGLNGFYLQSSTRPPAGVFIYTPDTRAEALPRQGERVAVSAKVGYYQRRLQLEWVQRIERCGSADLVVTPLSLPAEPARLRRLEDTLVSVPTSLVITGNHSLASYGELRLAVGGRIYQRGSGNARPAGVRLDDGRAIREPHPVPYLDQEGTRRVGDRLSGLTGVLEYAFDAWRIQPVEPPDFVNVNPRAMPPGRSGAWRVAGFNIENYFITLGSRGAGNNADLAAQRQRLVAAIHAMNADVLALQELENRPAATRDLLAALNRGEPRGRRYQAVANELERGDAVLRNVLLYRPARLNVEGAWIDNASVHDRAPIAALLSDRQGRAVLMASAHLKSRSRCPGAGDVDRGAGCWNRRRNRQAAALAEWLGNLEERTGAEHQLVLGDFNSYLGEPPLRAFERVAGLLPLAPGYVRPTERYTYVYAGRAGMLDHALGDDELRGIVRGMWIWHVNADEPPGIAGKGPWHSSDHDPVIVDLFWR